MLHSNGSGCFRQGDHIVPGSTFDGAPYQIMLSTTSFDHGSSANIRKGQMLTGEPLVVAVKMFGEMLDSVRQELLVRELRFARQVSLSHPLILAFLGTATVGEQTAIVSLYMRNGNLMEYIKGNPGCDKKLLIVQVAEAVRYLHRKARLVHGDIKCANVLVSDFGDALLADFGLSAFVEKSQVSSATMTAIRQMHTLQFAAPELLLGEGTVTPSKTCESDVYAFGMLVLEAITAGPPWPNQSNFSILRKVCNGEHPSRPSSKHGFVSISHSWWKTCKSCWRLAPEERPRIDDVLTALRSSEYIPCRDLPCEEHVTSVAFTSDGTMIIAGSREGSVMLFDAASGCYSHLEHRSTGYPVSVASSRDTQRLASAAHKTIRLWDAASGAQLMHIDPSHIVVCIAYSPDGTRIASGGLDCIVRLWDADTGTAVRQLSGHADLVSCVAFSPDGASVASGSHDGTVLLWDCATGCRSTTLTAPCRSDVNGIAFSPDGLCLVLAREDGMAIVWNVPERRPVHVLDVPACEVWCVAVSPCGKYVATGSEGPGIIIWDAESGEKIGAVAAGGEHGVGSLAFSPDGKTVVSTAWGRAVSVYDLFE